MGQLASRICVITGGAGSLGLASAQLFLDQGAIVHLVDLDLSALKAGAGSLRAAQDKIHVHAADVSDGGATRAYVEAAARATGRIDVLMCNAGIAGAVTPVADYPEELFDRVMAVNVRGTFLACKHALPLMGDGASVIITSSIMGVSANAGIAGYAASKHALIGLMRTIAREVAPRGIRVNALAPGPIGNDFHLAVEADISAMTGRNATRMIDERIPMGRHARASEVARMALFLAGDQSSFSTGSVFMADGGLNA